MNFSKNPKIRPRIITILTLLTYSLLDSTILHGRTLTYYMHNDQLGTPMAMSDAEQALVWVASRTPFGEINSETGVPQVAVFPGQYLDVSTGYSYNYFRDYDPSLGRYIQSDPIGLRGGLNTYIYAEDNPISMTDPFGLRPIPSRGWTRQECEKQFGILSGFATLAGIPISGFGISALKATDQLRYLAIPALTQTGALGGGISLMQALCADLPDKEEDDDICEEN